ncbi:MAG: acetyl-CoA carboxylase biotin carboxyl carrier protein [Rhodospirillaceae bacterium]|nr:acetyl-CoA carboxylase biotin carboxyl carrier protein [Rhodospirillaceae bacterium]
MSGFHIDSEQIRLLAAMMAETGLTELEVSEGGLKLRLARGVSMAAAAMPLAPPPAAVSAGSRPANDGLPAGAITSPMVGTAYLAPEPGAAPFVKPGDRVEEGDTVMIIEAMKVMNPIRAPRSGTVEQILIQDAQPVEFGEILMILV